MVGWIGIENLRVQVDLSKKLKALMKKYSATNPKSKPKKVVQFLYVPKKGKKLLIPKSGSNQV